MIQNSKITVLEEGFLKIWKYKGINSTIASEILAQGFVL